MITKYIRRRNQDPSKAFNKTFARIQVSGNEQTFRFKKTATTSPSVADYLNTEAGFRLTTEGGDNLTIG
jgi:hypothetical protein